MRQPPQELAELPNWLVNQGFALTEQRDVPQSFGDQIFGFERGPCGVRLVRDRSQWFLEVGRPLRDEWFDADIWRSCLEGNDPPKDPTALSDQVAYFKESLTR